MFAFISQPFAGFSIEEIDLIRQQAMKSIPSEFIILDNPVQNNCEENPLDGLGESIKLLSKANKVFFVYLNNKTLSRGQSIEKFICETYKIPYENIFVNSPL